MHHKRKIQKTAHFYTIGDIEAPITDLWIVCHGYGQLAKTFLEEFQCLEKSGRLIVAPEGLSRFYWGGFTGPIVSSWMTSGNRLDEIDDYCNWLDSIYEEFVKNLQSNGRITLLGFSQGTATAMRWLHARQPRIDQLILWAGMTPEDISYLPLQDYFQNIEKHFVYGQEDKFITKERMDWQLQFLKAQQLDFDIIPFSGKHHLEDATLLRLSK